MLLRLTVGTLLFLGTARMIRYTDT